jgi:hypothetical protein
VTIALNTIEQQTDGNLINMEGAQHVSIVDNTLRCNQPSADQYFAVYGKSLPAQADDPDTTQVDETRPPVPVDSLLVSQNRARGRCRALVRLEPFENKEPFVPIGAVTVTANQTRDLSFGVEFVGSILPSVTPRISENLFEGMPLAHFVQGPAHFTFNGSNGPQP